MKYVTYWHSQLLEMTRDCSAFGSVLFVVLACLVTLPYDRAMAPRLAVGLLCVEACGNAIKMLFYRDRPDPQPHRTFLEKLDAAAFPSIHTARSAMLGTIAGASGGWIPVWAAMTVLVAFSRMKLHKHHLGDVIAGAILGLLMGWLVWKLPAA